MKRLSRRQISTYIAHQLIAGESQQTLTRQLAAYLIETRQTKEVNLILRDVQYYLAKQGHVLGTVTTANELTESTKKTIEAYAKQATNASHITLDTVVDPSVLGGIRLSLPGVELDTTIARQLTALKTQYKKA